MITDSVKEEASSAISALYRLGVSKTLILSGDREERVNEIRKAVGIDEAFSALTPEGKYTILRNIIGNGCGKVMYVGDGINDSPSLALADVGVAMGSSGSDIAIEAADVIITSDNLTRIPEAVRISRKTLRIAKENIIFALGVKIVVMILSACGIANMWLAVFADVGVAALAILNSMRTLFLARRK